MGVYGKSILNYKKINEKRKALPLDIYSKSLLMAELLYKTKNNKIYNSQVYNQYIPEN